jgi:hypothetical protein
VQRLSFLRTTDKNSSVLDQSGFDVLEAALEILRPDVFMLDPLVAFCGGGSMNDNAVMSLVMRELSGHLSAFIEVNGRTRVDPSASAGLQLSRIQGTDQGFLSGRSMPLHRA